MLIESWRMRQQQTNWLDRVSSVIPREFSCHYVLTSIREVPMSGKEIIDKAIAESGGTWNANWQEHFLKTELRKVDQQQTQESDNINNKGYTLLYPFRFVTCICSFWIYTSEMFLFSGSSYQSGHTVIRWCHRELLPGYRTVVANNFRLLVCLL